MGRVLEGKRVLITGASRGVGYEIIKLFLEEGASIIVVAKDEKRLKEAELEFKKLGDFEGLVLDISQKGFEEEVATAVKNKWNALDNLINNAGVMLAYGGFLEEDKDILEKTFKVNLYAPYYLIRAMVPFLLKGNEPRIVNVSSGAGTFKL